jgi:hypothetical protein
MRWVTIRKLNSSNRKGMLPAMENNSADHDAEWSIEREITDVRMQKPHFVLLGAGDSKAALPDGDKNGRAVPLLREVSEELSLVDLFPGDLCDLALDDFEAAYSEMVDRGAPVVDELNDAVGNYFAGLLFHAEQ